MAKAIQLSVHRNGIEARRKRDLANTLGKQIPKLVRDIDVRAYAFIAMDSTGASHCLWDTGSIVPMWCFPSMIESMLRRDLEEAGVPEDWKPALTTRVE